MIVDVGLVHLQLRGGADLKEGLGVGDIVRCQLDLLVQNGLLILIALDGGVIADPGGVVAGQGAAQVQGAQDVPRLHQVAGLEVHGGALGGTGDQDGGGIVRADLAGDLILRGDGAGGDGLHLDGHAHRAGLGLVFAAAGGEGQSGGCRQKQNFDALRSHAILLDQFKMPFCTAQQYVL